MPIRRWHRATGIIAAGLLVYLLITGVPLQFSAQLKLGNTYVSTNWILDWYGFTAPKKVVGSGPMAQVDDQLYWKSQFIGRSQTLIGSVKAQNLLLVATRHELLFLHERTGELVDRSYHDATLKKIGRLDDRVYLETSNGLLIADQRLTNWFATDNSSDTIVWTATSTLGATEAEPYQRAYRSRLLNVERMLQDLHSGRFFGVIGIVIITIASALLLFLAATGLMLWWRSRHV